MALSASYQQASRYRQTQAETASPIQLVVMLYDGAIRFLSVAREKMDLGDLEVRHNHILKAQRILGELLSTLDTKQGGEVAANLQRLYTYMIEQLVEANLNDKKEPIDLVIRMLRELRESWVELDKQTLPVALGSSGDSD